MPRRVAQSLRVSMRGGASREASPGSVVGVTRAASCLTSKIWVSHQRSSPSRFCQEGVSRSAHGAARCLSSGPCSWNPQVGAMTCRAQSLSRRTRGPSTRVAKIADGRNQSRRCARVPSIDGAEKLQSRTTGGLWARLFRPPPELRCEASAPRARTGCALFRARCSSLACALAARACPRAACTAAG